MTPEEFVKQAYYAQEKTILDFWPSDDKYKEMLYEANLVLQELQNAQDWSWLRERLVLGSCACEEGSQAIPEFVLPSWVYKVSTKHHDSLKLHDVLESGDLDPYDYIEVPFTSAGSNGWRKDVDVSEQGFLHLPDIELKALTVGNVLAFNRPLMPYEALRTAVVDVQRRLAPLHVCTDACNGVDPSKPISYYRTADGAYENPCAEIEDEAFPEVPDPNYMVMATAARHAEGSPPAQLRVQTLTDAAQRILSAMRANDAAATDAEYLDREHIGWIEVV